ncbi:MAG: sulfatase-like hydrolase/transferase, partial [Acidobacteriota bacterium]
MHRSGTSAMAGVLARLGVPLGDSLVDGAEDKPSGYFEHRDIVAIHDALALTVGTAPGSLEARGDARYYERRPSSLHRTVSIRIMRNYSRVALFSLMFVALALQGACGSRSDVRSDVPVERIVGALPADRFQFGGDSLDEVFRWDLGAGNSLGAWDIRADETREQDAEFLRLSGSDRSSLIRDVNFDAGDVDRILVRMTGLSLGRTRVYWARQGEQFSAERQVSLRSRDAVDGVYEFPVSRHPEWRGRIVHFRFDGTNSPGEQVRVASIVGARAGADLPNSFYRRTWGFEYDQELRAGTLVMPDAPQIRTVATPAPTRLYFANAVVLAPRAGPVRLSVSRVDGEREEQLYERTVTKDDRAQLTDWVMASVDIDASQAAADLRFAIDCPQAERCAGTFASVETRGLAPADKTNVVLISIDTLRPDRMSLYGHDRPTTPNIDRWAGQSGVTFERVVAASPWTLPSHVSMFTGLDATTHNVNFNTPIPEELELLSERLHADGYFTAAITGGGFVAPEFGFWQGFDVYAYWQRSVERYWRDQTASGTELPSGLRRASQLLDEIDGRPFFLFFHTYEVHSPFHAQLPHFEQFYGRLPDAPGAFVTTRPRAQTAQNGYKLFRSLALNDPENGIHTMGQEEIPLARAMYDSGVAFTDARIGELLAELETRDLLDDTIIVLTSDHGEMLGEMGLAGHAYLHEENVRIPLVISWPAGFEGGTRVDDLVRTVDIAPTILDLLGIEAREGLDGHSLVPQVEGRPAGRQPTAVTYAASSNHGLALRLPNDLVYVYDNSIWRSGRADQLAPTDRDSSAVDLDFGDREDQLLRETERLLESRKGLHMAVVNEQGLAEYTVRMRGSVVRREKIKATQLACACATWVPEGSTLVLRVPGGNDFNIQFEDASAGNLFIEIQEGDRVFEASVSLGDLADPVAFVRSPDGWEQS